MPTMDIHSVCRFLDGLFADCTPADDCSNNGLQVEASRDVARVAFAVDACLETIRGAAAADAQLLVVHHGLSWGGGFRKLTGIEAGRYAALFSNEVSLYACHLPLDANPLFGNNAVLARRMGLEVTERFAEHGGIPLAVACRLPSPEPLSAIADRAAAALHGGPVRTLDFSNGKPVRKVAVITGSGAGDLEECARQGVDCLVTGEISHPRYHTAKETGISVVLGGHYATEDTGIRELMRTLGETLRLETVFIDAPTGL